MHLSAQPILDSYLAVVLIALGLFLLLFLGPTVRRLTPNQRGVLTALRAGVILLLIIALLRPTWISRTKKPLSYVLVLLFDQSRSMQLPHATGEKSRWDAQKEMLERAQGKLDDLGETVKLKVYAYDSTLHAIEHDKGTIRFPESAAGVQTDIGTILSEAIARELGERVAGVILTGDGRQTAFNPRVEIHGASRELEQLQAPLFPITFGPAGDAEQSRDIALENLPEQYSVFVKNELLVKGVLRVRGYVNQEIPVELILEDEQGQSRVVSQISLMARQDNEQVEIAIKYVPQKAGRYKLTLRAALQPGELATKNNQLTSFLTVLEGGLRILYLEGELRQEQKFLRRTINASADMQLDFRWLERRGDSEGWPVDLSDVLLDAKYDVFILGDLDADALGKENLQLIADAVEQGTGLIMTGGYHSFGPGGYRPTPLADVLPIVMDPRERQEFNKPIRPDVHLKGSVAMLPTGDHPIMRLGLAARSQQIWQSLKPLKGANQFVGIKNAPGVQVLAESPQGDPLLVSGEYSKGRVLAFAGDSTWQWRRQGRQDEYKRFWRQVILWLVRRDELTKNDVWIDLAGRRFNLGGRVEFSTGAKTAAGDLIEDAELKVDLVGPDGSRQPVQLVHDGDKLTASLDALDQAGEYTLEAIATRQGKQLGTAREQFIVFDRDVELSNPAANHAQMARLAEATQEFGGKVIQPEQLSELLEEIKKNCSKQSIEVETKWTLGKTALDAWAFLLFFVGLLSVEWWLRKKWGLV